MKPTKTLVRIAHGSLLYGTNTPLSDHDYKSIHIPSGTNIILQRAERLEGVIDKTIKVSTGLKNTLEDVDDQSYLLQKFFKMCVDGDTTATEILFANKTQDGSDEWNDVLAYRHRFLNRKCKGFVGYCKQQAAKYGIKGSRMGTLEALLALFERCKDMGSNPSLPLSLLAFPLAEFADKHDYAKIVTIPNQHGANELYLEVLEKKVPYNATFKTAIDLYQKIYDNYGERARLAKLNEGIDWKALSHAVRVGRQAIELLSTGFITFPRPDAEELLAIKQGKIPYVIVQALLEELVDQVEEASKVSILPQESDHALMDKIVTNFYMDQLSHDYRFNINA